MLRVLTLLPCAYFTLAKVKASLKRDTLWLKNMVEIDGVSPPVTMATEPHLLDLSESVRLAAKLQISPTDCLPRSICVAELAKKQGYDISVKIGISKRMGQFFSHAWVEVNEEQGRSLLCEPENVAFDFTTLGTKY